MLALLGRWLDAERLDPHRLRVRGVVDLIELHAFGPEEDLAAPGVGQRDVAVEPAGPVADQGPLEGRMRAHEQLAELHADAGLGLAVEVEFHHVVRRRRGPDAIDDAWPFQVGQDQAAGFLSDEGILPAEAVVVAAGAVVARHGRHLDRVAERGELVEPIQLLDPRRQAGVGGLAVQHDERDKTDPGEEVVLLHVLSFHSNRHWERPVTF